MPVFGRKMLSLPIEDCLALEADTSRRQRFLPVDLLVGQVLTAAFQGVRIVSLLRDDIRGAKTSILVLNGASHDHLNDIFAIDRQEGRGAWYLPYSVSLKLGLANLVAHFQAHPQFAMGIVSEEHANVRLNSSPDAPCVWAIIEPFFELLWQPLQMRGPLTGALTRNEFHTQWQRVVTFFRAMELPCDHELARLQYGCGWGGLSMTQQLDRKLALINAVATHYCGDLPARFRMFRIRQLAKQYYSKANAHGQAERRKVLTTTYHPVLSGVFAGDWMAFLEYLDETPHPDEQIATALPDARLYLMDTSKATAIATIENLPLAEIERMVAAFWDRRGAAVSPIEERVAVLQRYWRVFDEIHTQQQPGKQPLWGLIEARGLSNVDGAGEGLYRSDLYRTSLPDGLVSDIENLWSGTTLPSHPEFIVSEIFPHALMAEAFGPALAFWHGCALTAWFIVEGPSSRTDMAGLAHHYRRNLAELEDLDCSVDPRLFQRLTVASRRGGFKRLRDVITQYRTEWAGRNLERYLCARWERQLKAVAEDYNRWVHEKGRPPVLKQFAKVAAEVADHWFGGDLAGVYGAIGEKMYQRPTRRIIMPPDRRGFAQSVYKALRDHPIERRTPVQSPDQPQSQAAAQERQYSLVELSRLSLSYIQLEEALGRPPELREFGKSRFERIGQVLGDNIEKAWTKYAEVIRTVMPSPPSA